MIIIPKRWHRHSLYVKKKGGKGFASTEDGADATIRGLESMDWRKKT